MTAELIFKNNLFSDSPIMDLDLRDQILEQNLRESYYTILC